MRKQFIILLIFGIFTCIPAAAQTKVGIKAGINFTTLKGQYPYYQEVDKQLISGFNAGFILDIPLFKSIYLQPGISFTTKGYKTKENIRLIGGDVIYADGKERHKAYYLELPVNFLYKHSLGIGNILVGGGPYIAYGIGGNWENISDKGSTGDIHGKLEFVKDYKDQTLEIEKEVYGKPFDFGVNVLLGYELSHEWTVQLNGEWGLIDITPKDNGREISTENPLKNVAFGLSLVYKF